MSTLLEQASLVMIPSGYKEDVVYSQIPTNGNGDLSFTRASNGTRINSAGLVEVCPWNLLQQSEDFTTTWNQVALTIGTNATTAPNGTTTADSFTSNTSSANHVAYQLLTGVSGAYTFSVYVKKANSRYVYIKLVGGASDWVAAVFDLNDGTLTKSQATGWTGLTASSESVGNGWYRLIVSGSGATSVDFNVGVQYTNTGTPTFSVYADASFTGTGTIDYYIWGAQLNIGSTAKPYFPTTDRLNVPRLTYQNGGGGCPSLLLEKQSTNLITYSEDISNSFGTKFQVTITSNNTTSPDGTQNADLLKFDSTTSYILRNQTVNASTAYTMSVFVKNNNFTSGQKLTFNMSDGVVGGLTADINVVAKTATFSAASGAFTSVSGKVEDYGNGWFRVSVTGTSVNGGGGWYEMAAAGITNSCFVWGFSLETSSYVTSYIPTTSSSATRVLDECSKTGISSLIGQTEGVLFVDFVFTAYDYDPKWVAFLGGGASYIGIYTQSTPEFVCEIANSGVPQFFSNTYVFSVGQRYKLAIAYKANDFAFYVNGTQVATDSSGTVPATSQFSLQYNTATANLTSRIYNQVALFPTRLTNAELASLTTI